MNQFQQQLTKLRQAAGLSQEQLADQLHVSRQAISKWENGSALPDIEKIIQIASILHVSLDKLVLAKEPAVSQSKLDRLIDAHIQQNQQENHWRYQESNNGWEFLARYWWIIPALGGIICGIVGAFR
ncbi:helix-turn-helix domain-containing protein [Limosilactobacillus oris]|uniref:helix-turn-helix domain-containing protein n=1 Tax=Limosilactobacillus oris TaxID=1632 RepID=UPI0024B3931C|nr:helix-turn-helix transcriptional regulator [Limosilactobacillus oris]WHO85593.1 helix-turn-helix transcriptional regulator [Limosilactobacillus oris]